MNGVSLIIVCALRMPIFACLLSTFHGFTTLGTAIQGLSQDFETGNLYA